MFVNVINELEKPTINNFPQNRNTNDEHFDLMTEESNLFENLLNQMKLSTNSSQKKAVCSNPNCKNFFFSLIACKNGCGNMFCNQCIVKCQQCETQLCKFCSQIKYEKFQDLILCPSCNSNN